MNARLFAQALNTLFYVGALVAMVRSHAPAWAFGMLLAIVIAPRVIPAP